MSRKRNKLSTIEYNKKFLNKNEDSKYENWYNNLIDRAKNRNRDNGVLYERHHIIPKCIGGEDTEDNTVLLTIKEHVLAHKLLHEIYPDCPGIALAVVGMLLPKNHDRNSEKYFSLREATYYREKARLSMMGRPRDEEYRLNLSKGHLGQPAWNKGIPLSEDQKQKLRDSWSHMPEEKKNEWKRKLSLSRLGKPAHNRIAVVGPDGTEYSSYSEAAKYNNVSERTISNWIHRYHKPGWRIK